MYIKKLKVNNNNGGFMKKILLIFIIILLLFLYGKKEEETAVFSYIDAEVFDNYYIKFNNCDLNTNNFIDKLSYLEYKEYKILEIIPEISLGETYKFYSNDLEDVLDKFKNKYINLMINDSKYITNICIKEIKINTSNYILDELKNKIPFSY